ncbi:MAG: PLP-dependent aminotransferase family protein [Azospirillum brasilense]|uniref:GntR family transcriptional regulator n=1 Tax=Roseomonas gilardii TaxID=257708 RepID=A0A1L7AHT0_9PROT|nr:PLP-dependent aminotransferase family protein [Roseomonas gilardii]APT58348.1 GntR family transcriptional regulator [Roseomonas gilardii]PZR11541.1 MAG: PLP-dependent aminotransferase family protein [Azospirillum brasilense]
MPTNSRRKPEVLDMPLLLDGAGSQSGRLHAGLRAAILGGRLAPGLRLPSSRDLATQLGLRRNAVVIAYEQLLSDGLAEARVGAGTFVAARVPRGPGAAAPAGAAIPIPGQAPFALGRTQADPALLRQFGRLIRRHLTADAAHFGYGDPRGVEALRQAIAAHLAATRGIACDPGRVLVTSGTQQALRLCAEVLLRPGDAVWMEDPGYPSARRILEACGARLVPVPVDRHGLDAEEGRRQAPAARLAYVTPSHQFPTGVTMSMERRLALLDWAREAGSWVVEDDYDSEFRYAGPPLTALAGIDARERVIYLGTFSKTLFPGLRTGFAVLPGELLEKVTAARLVGDRFPPSLTGEALAELIRDGGFAAHVRRMRSRYRIARDLLAELLPRASGGLLRVTVPDQGLSLLALLPEDWPPGTAARIRAAAGIEGWLLSETRLVQQGPDGFVLGFSGHSLPALRRAAERLGEAVRAWSPGAAAA